jgi:predicted nucleic acid-binding protein
MPAILIDTNVLVYASDPADPTRQQRAITVLKHLDETGVGRLSVQCLAELANVLTRGPRPLYSFGDALRIVESLARIYPVHDLTPMMVLEAIRGARDYSLAYYDAQIWACARLNQAPVIFSEDFNHGSTLEGVRFVNPFAPDFDLAAWD